MTRQALHAIPVLPLEQVDNKTIVPLLVYLPLLFRRDGRRQRLERGFPFRCHLHWRRFRAYPIEVLVQAVQQEAEELLGIVLVRAGE